MKFFYIIFFCFSSIGLNAANYAGKINLSGFVDFLNDNDSVILKMPVYGCLYDYLPFQATYISKVKNHSFQFELKAGDTPQYIDLIFSTNGNSNFIHYLVETGDNIKISILNNIKKITGTHALNFEVQYQMQQIDNSYLNKYPHTFSMANLYKVLEISDSAAMKKISYLESKKSLLNNGLFIILKSDILSITESDKANYLQWYCIPDSINQAFIDTLNAHKNILYNQLLKSFFDSVLDTKFLIQSAFYANYQIEKYKFDSALAIRKPFDIAKCYTYLTEHYSGLLRESLITYLLHEYRMANLDLSNVVADAIINTKNIYFEYVLKKIKNSCIKGAEAYNFSLEDIHGNICKLSDFAGNVILLDFWFTGCGNCIRVHPYLDSIRQKLNGKPFKLISINIDTDKQTWLHSITGEEYTSSKSTNLYTNGLGDKAAIIQHYEIGGYPTLILIDKTGKLSIPPIDPRIDKGEHLMFLINNCLK
jgi:thiol-disulfide isomerase/thioredoxin